MTVSSVDSLTVVGVGTDGDLLARAASRIAPSGAAAVETVRTAEEGLARVSEADCLVARNALPDADGVTLVERLRGSHPHFPVILVTDQPDDRVASAAVSAGVTDYVRRDGEDPAAALATAIADGVAAYESEQALRESEQRYRTLVERSHDGIYIYQDDSFLFVNDRIPEITGYDPEELYGMEIWELLHPDDREWVKAVGARRRRGEADAPNTYDARVVRKDGEIRHLEFSVQTTTYDGEEAVLGSVRDVTERRRKERELADTTEFIETIVEAVGDAVYTLDEQGRITFVNDALLSVTGYEEEELLGEFVGKVMRQQDVETARELIAELLESDERTRATFEMEAIGRDGTHLRCEDNMALLVSDGEFRGTAGVVRDISRRKAREQQLRRQNERLDRFASVVSHDLRNPLNVILGRVDLARECPGEEHLDAIERSASRMERMIDDLLTLARDGRTVGETEPIDLAAAARRAWKNVETDEATLHLEDDLGTLSADRARLASLLENLFRNAVEHGSTGNRTEPGDAVEHGDESVTVSVGPIDDRGSVADGGHAASGFYVEDDGPGIPDEKRDDVFDSGYTTSEEGTGLGLVIVKDIAEAHDWTIRVTDGAGRSSASGARFEIDGIDWTDR